MNDFKFPQIEKLIDWFINIRLKEECPELFNIPDEVIEGEVKLALYQLLISFVEDIVADTVRLNK
jgi:hypothetical protein